MNKITWTAKNNSSYLNGCRTAPSITAAVRAARRYVRCELYGVGIITVFNNDYPIRKDERSISTKFQWSTTIL